MLWNELLKKTRDGFGFLIFYPTTIQCMKLKFL